MYNRGTPPIGSDPIASWGNTGDTIGVFISLNKSLESENFIRWFKNGVEVNAKVMFNWSSPYKPYFLIVLMSSMLDMRLKYLGENIPTNFEQHHKEWKCFDSY